MSGVKGSDRDNFMSELLQQPYGVIQPLDTVLVHIPTHKGVRREGDGMANRSPMTFARKTAIKGIMFAPILFPAIMLVSAYMR